MKKLVRKLLIFTFMALLVAVPVTTVTTTNVSAATVKLNKKKLVIKKGKSKKIKLQGVSSKDVKWKTTDKTVAKVKNGKVTAKNVGVCYINATNKKTKKTYKCRVAVPGVRVVDGYDIKLTSDPKKTIEIMPGKFKNIYTVNKKGVGKFKWTTSDKSIARVYGEDGRVAVAANDNSKTGRCTVIGKLKGKVVYKFEIVILDKKGNDPAEASKVLEKPNFKIIDKDGNELLQLDSINQLYRYEYTEMDASKGCYTEFFKDVSGVFVLKAQNIENPTWQYYFKESKTPYTTYNDVINKIQVVGTNEKVVYDYDNMTNHDEGVDKAYKGHPGADNSSKILADGTVVGGNNGSSKDCSVSKIKVGDKYYLIEVIFSRKGFEYYRSHYGISPIAALKHDEIFNEDLSAWRSNPTSPLNEIKNKTQTDE